MAMIVDKPQPKSNVIASGNRNSIIQLPTAPVKAKIPEKTALTPYASAITTPVQKKADPVTPPKTTTTTTKSTAKAPVASAAPAASTGPTAEEKASADNLLLIAAANAAAAIAQYDQAMASYAQADAQNAQLAKIEKQQHSKTTASDRFAQLKKLQSSTSGITAAAGNALQGSQTGNMISMLRGRGDLDSTEALDALTLNYNAVSNALDESLNTNAIARNDAASAAEAALREIESDTAAQLNNLDPKLFVAPGTGKANFGATGYAASRLTPANMAKLSGYFMPEAQLPNGNALMRSGSSYYDSLINEPNRRK